ncbi:MAG: beta-galactosidase, partial [bacterium]
MLIYATFAIAASAPARADSAPNTISDDSFCLHVHSHPGYEKAFSAVPFGTFRTWDSGISWPTLEPEKGKWDWALLDNYVRLARAKNIKLIFTLGMTPKWAAKNPDAPSPYGGNISSSPPRDIADWENFIRKVA